MNRRPFLLAGLVLGSAAMSQATAPAHAASFAEKTLRAQQRQRDEKRSKPSPNPSPNRTSGRLLGNPTSGSATLRGSSRVHPNPSGLNGGMRQGSERRNPFNNGLGSNLSGRIPQPGASGMRQVHPPPAGTVLRYENRNQPVGGLFGQQNQMRVVTPQNNAAPTFSQPGAVLGGPNANPSLRNQRRLENRARRNRPYELRSPNADGTTEVGRILGNTRPVDPQGRTEAGRVLGTTRPVDRQGRTNVGRAMGARNSPQYFVGPRRDPVYTYNPRTGRYDPYTLRSSNHISVLLGSSARKPRHRFRHRRHYGLYYYPYYFTDTLSIGYNAYPSPYFYYGYVPLYVPSTRVVVVDRPVVIDSGSYVADDTEAYYLNRSAAQPLDTALDEIRRAWVLGDIDLLLRHVRSDQEVHVYLKGDYVYSLPAEDYRDLTQDAMKNSITTGFRWINIDRRSNDEVQARAEHTFTDNDGERRTVFATYTLVRIHGAWWVAEVGSSDRGAD